MCDRVDEGNVSFFYCWVGCKQTHRLFKLVALLHATFFVHLIDIETILRVGTIINYNAIGFFSVCVWGKIDSQSIVLTGSKVKDNLFIIPWSRGIRKYKQYETVKFDVQVWHVSAMNRQCTSFILQLDILQHASYLILRILQKIGYIKISLTQSYPLFK